jgi:pimeloyl-ACP methyl ester carboxylesterase
MSESNEVRRRKIASACLGVAVAASAFPVRAGEPSRVSVVPTHGRTYSIAGLPQHDFTLDAEYEHGTLTELSCVGTVGFIIRPKDVIDAQRRWAWISNLFLAVNYDKRKDVAHRCYVERLLAAGFHVVGIDVGTSCGSPAGAEVYAKFYDLLQAEFRLHPKARMIGQSNAGLIAYGFAFRYPERVERILGIMPATDLTSWPGLYRLTEPARFTPAGLSYDLTKAEWDVRLKEFNPIDRLAPLEKAGVKLFHVHGTADDVVPLEPNTAELARRYRALGGAIEVELIEGGTHGAPNKAFYESERAIEFLLAP